MFATLLSVALFILLAIQSVTAEFAIDTPESITAVRRLQMMFQNVQQHWVDGFLQCKPITFKWEDTKAAPYNLVIVESTDPCGDIL